MANLRNAFQRAGRTSTLPEMMKVLKELKASLPKLKKANAANSLFEAAISRDIVVSAAEIEADHCHRSG